MCEIDYHIIHHPRTTSKSNDSSSSKTYGKQLKEDTKYTPFRKKPSEYQNKKRLEWKIKKDECRSPTAKTKPSVAYV